MTDSPKKPENPPAFPGVFPDNPSELKNFSSGISIWDYYMAHALAGCCANTRLVDESKRAAEIADEALLEREKRGIG
jgi:hypothetical protein